MKTSTETQSRGTAGAGGSTQEGTQSAGGSSVKNGLRGLSYDEQVSALTPRPEGSASNAQVNEDDGGDHATDGDDGGRVSPKAASERLDAILGADNAPLGEAVKAEAESLIPHLSKKKQPLYRVRLDARIASGDAEAELATLLDGRGTPPTAAERDRAQALLNGPVAEDRRAAWQTKVDAAVAWAAVDEQLTALFGKLAGPLDDAGIAAAEGLITQLPDAARATWSDKLAGQIANDRAEGQLETLIGQDDRLSDAQRDEARGLIASLTNGRSAHWDGELAKRIEVDDTKHTFYESQVDNKSQKDADGNAISGNIQCNVTSTAMQILQLAGSRRVANEAGVELLASKGDKSWQKKVADGTKIEDLQLEEMLLARILLTSKADWDKITYHGIWDSAPQERAVVLNAVVAEFEASGLVESTAYAERGSKQTGQEFFLKLRRDKLAGKNWASSIGTNLTSAGHVVNLVDVRDDGVIVNDPFGLAISQDNYIPNGSTVAKGQRQCAKNPAVIDRRARFNSRVKDLLTASTASEDIETAWGALNFYDWSDVEKLSIGRWANMAYGKDEEGEAGDKYAADTR